MLGTCAAAYSATLTAPLLPITSSEAASKSAILSKYPKVSALFTDNNYRKLDNNVKISDFYITFFVIVIKEVIDQDNTMKAYVF